MTGALARRSVTPEIVQMAGVLGPMAHASRLFGINSPEQAIAIMLTGYELGFGLTASFDFIHIIQGKPSISPRGALALVHASGELAGMTIDEQPDRCTVTMKRRNGLEYTTTFSLQDALAADLIKPDSAWIKWQRNMLRWRPIGFCIDVLFPDVVGGLRRSDEYGAPVDIDGNVIAGEAVPHG